MITDDLTLSISGKSKEKRVASSSPSRVKDANSKAAKQSKWRHRSPSTEEEILGEDPDSSTDPPFQVEGLIPPSKQSFGMGSTGLSSALDMARATRLWAL